MNDLASTSGELINHKSIIVSYNPLITHFQSMTKFIYIICIHTINTNKCIFKKLLQFSWNFDDLIVKSIDSASLSMISCHYAPYFLKTFLRFSYICAIIIALRYHFNHLLCLSSQNSFRIMYLLRKFYSFSSHENIRLGIGIVN